MVNVSKCLVAILAALVFAPIVLQVIFEVRAGSGVLATEIFRRFPTKTNLRAYEKSLSESLLVAKIVRPRVAEAFDRALRRGNGKVVEASGDWLYYGEDFTFLSAPGLDEVHATNAHRTEVRVNRPFEAILDYHKQLRAAGIDLVVVAIPEKATIVPERLSRRLAPDSAPNNRDLVTSLERLAASGVFVIELTTPLLEAKARGVPVFLPLDTHWSPDAAKLSARFVADRVRTLSTYRAFSTPRVEFDHRHVSFERRGDLYQLLAYADRGTVFPLHTFVVEQVLPLGNGPGPKSRASPVLVLGDSFTVIYGDALLGMGQFGGFADHLADELGLPLDVVAIPGGGPNRSREALALREEGVRGKRIVIWQLAERDLLNKDVGWSNTPLPAPRAVAAPTSTPEPVDRRVRARLTAVSALPERLPYADCLVVTRHEPIGPAAGLPSPFFVAMWGRRNWQPAAGSEAVVGTVSDLVLVPIRRRQDIERTCFADTVGMSGQLFWADEMTVAK